MTKQEREQFGRRLRASREDCRFSQSDLGGRLGCMGSHISHFESGRRLPSFEKLRGLADVLGVSADYLLGLRATP